MENKDLPAYPQPIAECQGAIHETGDYNSNAIGLSKRELIAAMSMKGLLSCYEAQQDMQSDPRYNGENFKEVVALNSIEFADALMRELSKPQP